MRCVTWLVSVFLVLGTAHAAEGRKYAVLSLIGDGMLISEWVPSTGARLDNNQKTFIPISEGVFDKAALLSINGALKKIDPAAAPVLLFARERSLYEAQNRMLDANGKTVDLFEHVRVLLRGQNATHLILVTKLRHEARLKMADQTVGTGTLEGVGFYIDSSMRTKFNQTGEMGSGLLAPFAYFRVELIDLARGAAVSEQRVVASTTTSALSTTAEHAWNALSGSEKVRILREMVTDETAAVIPKLVAVP